VLRETTFLVGGAVVVAMGVLLGAGLFWSGAGVDYAGAWIAAALSVGFGAFFFQVGRAEGRSRREYLRALEEGRSPPPGPPPV
jgi:hypothetical protein